MSGKPLQSNVMSFAEREDLKEYIDDALRAHEDKDTLRFDRVTSDIKELKDLAKLLLAGSFSTVGLAVINLVLKHGG